MKIISLFFILFLITAAQAFAESKEVAFSTTSTISARSPEILATYQQADAFVAGLDGLRPRLQRICKSLLDSQLKLLKETDSWKMYSFYEMLTEQRLMTGKLQRVGTITEMPGVIPKYTDYRLKNVDTSDLSLLRSGSLIFSDKGAQCGPDPLSVTKGAYFVKCGDYLIGSGLIRVEELKIKECLNVRVMQQDL
jgi:hypothetical protein